MCRALPRVGAFSEIRDLGSDAVAAIWECPIEDQLQMIIPGINICKP
jgi:hypothetical protein